MTMRMVLDLDPVSVCDVTKLVARGVLSAGHPTPRGAVVFELRDVDAFETWADKAADWQANIERGAECFEGDCEHAQSCKEAESALVKAREALATLANAVEGLKSATARRQLAAAMTELEGALES